MDRAGGINRVRNSKADIGEEMMDMLMSTDGNVVEGQLAGGSK